MRKNITKTCSDCGKKVRWYYGVRCRPCRNKLTSIDKRFLNYVNKTNTCWLWTGYIDTLGYGIVGNNKKVQKAHRVSWFLHNGPIPKQMKVLHKCDVRNCVNPEHLWLGTQLENIADAKAKKRNAFGERHSHAVLTEEIVNKIRKIHKPWDRSVSATKLSKLFGVSKETIYSVVEGKTWKHLPPFSTTT